MITDFEKLWYEMGSEYLEESFDSPENLSAYQLIIIIGYILESGKQMIEIKNRQINGLL
jgi:hypothetical protein